MSLDFNTEAFEGLFVRLIAIGNIRSVGTIPVYRLNINTGTNRVHAFEESPGVENEFGFVPVFKITLESLKRSMEPGFGEFAKRIIVRSEVGEGENEEATVFPSFEQTRIIVESKILPYPNQIETFRHVYLFLI